MSRSFGHERRERKNGRQATVTFAQDPESEDAAAREIVIRVRRAVKAARPFFDWTADQAVAASRVNVVNNS